MRLSQDFRLMWLFKLFVTNGDIDRVITNCPDETVTAQVAQDADGVRWQVEEL